MSNSPLGCHYWWLTGILGPHLGAVLGEAIYYITCDNLSQEPEEAGRKSKYEAENDCKESQKMVETGI